VVQADASQVEVVVEPYVLPSSAGVGVGGEPTVAADANAGVDVAIEVGR
jgi:hypothetical protein